MKKTLFMKTCDGESNQLILLNTLSGDLTIVSPENRKEWEYVLNNPDSSEQKDILSYLMEKGYIINDDIDEQARTELKFFEAAHSNNELLLTILPTEDCNFRCAYCYEEHNIGKMSREVIERIKLYLKKELPKYKMLQVNWFGGEPLEAIDIIEELSLFFIHLCSELRIPYRASMTTNGYNLNLSTFKKLYGLHIIDYQITIDGNEETHNASRPHKDGANSHKAIIENLRSIRDNVRSNNFKITIRTNITKSVMKIIDRHIDFLSTEFGEDKRFGVIFKIAWSNGVDNEYNKNELLPTGDLKYVLEKCNNKKLRFYLNRTQICTSEGICYAAHSTAFVIGADGSLYKCTIEFKNAINRIGKLDKNGKAVIDKDKLAFWVTNSPFKEEYEKCVLCFFRPACMGVHCPLKRYDEKGNHQCSGMKNYVEAYMKLCSQYENVKWR